MPDNTKKAERKEHVVKVGTHTHAGEPCKKGDKIKLTAAQAEKLKKDGVI